MNPENAYLFCYVEQPTTCKDAKPSQNPEWAVSGQLWSKEACDSGKQTFQLCSQSVLTLFYFQSSNICLWRLYEYHMPISARCNRPTYPDLWCDDVDGGEIYLFEDCDGDGVILL